jgi:hypothetical protein
VIIFIIHGKNNFKFDTTGIQINKTNYLVGSRSFRPDIQKPRQMENAARDIYCFLKGIELMVHRCEKYVEK